MLRTLLLAVVTAACALSSLGSTAAAEHANRPRYVVVGDSLTGGTGTSDPETIAFPTLAGVKAVSTAGGCIALACFGHVAVKDNFTSTIEAMERRPDVVVIELGVNDLHLTTDAELIRAYRAVRAQGRALGIEVVLATIAPLHVDCPCIVLDDQRTRINAWIRMRRHYVDLDAALRRGDGTMRDRYDSGDGLHPNDAGAAAMAAALRTWIADREASPNAPGERSLS